MTTNKAENNEPRTLYGITEFAKELGWTQNKTQVYYQRGVLPGPCAYAGTRPFWKLEQIEEYKKERRRKKRRRKSDEKAGE